MGSLGQRQERARAGLRRGNGGSGRVRERTGWAEAMQVGLLSWAGKPGRERKERRAGAVWAEWLLDVGLDWVFVFLWFSFPFSFLFFSNQLKLI